jgi:hypothetical protein
MLAGGELFFGGRTPAKPKWSEVMIFLGVFLRQGSPFPEVVVSSDEAGAHRKTDLRRRAQLRGANVGRRTSISRRLYSGEAAVVGGDDLFGGFPPAGKPLTGGNPLPEKRVVPASSVPARECSPEYVDFPAAQLRRSRGGRR